jgi:hypothetical protein
MSFSQTTKARMVEKGHAERFPTIRKMTHQLLDFIDQLDAKRTEIAGNAKFSESGKAGWLKETAEKAAPALGKLARELETENTKLAAARANLAPKFPKTDTTLLIALANALASMSSGDRIKALNATDADPRLLQAAFELPSALHRADPAMLGAIKNRIIADTHGPKLAELDSREDAISIAAGALSKAQETLVNAAGMTSSPVLAERWLENLTKPSAADVAAEAAAAHRVTVEEMAAAAKGFDAKARHELMDHLLAQSDADIERRVAELRAS